MKYAVCDGFAPEERIKRPIKKDPGYERNKEIGYISLPVLLGIVCYFKQKTDNLVG